MMELTGAALTEAAQLPAGSGCAADTISAQKRRVCFDHTVLNVAPCCGNPSGSSPLPKPG